MLTKTQTIVNEPTTLHEAWVNFEDADFYEDDLPLTELKNTNEHRERTSNECKGRTSNEFRGRANNELKEKTSNEFKGRTSNDLKETTSNTFKERPNEFKGGTALPKYDQETNECKDGTKENSKKQKTNSKTLGGTKSKRKKEVSLEQLNKKIRKLEKLTQIKSDFVRLNMNICNAELFGDFGTVENIDMDDKSLVKAEFVEGEVKMAAEDEIVKKKQKIERKKLNESVVIKQESLPIEYENGFKGTAKNIEVLILIFIH